MKINKLFLGLATIAAAVFSFSSCSSEEAESMQLPSETRTISFTTSLAMTRATSDPQAGTSLSTNSQLAIFAVNGSEALTNGNNEQYRVDSNGNLNPSTSSNTMTWPDGATLNFYAYAPYNNSYTYNGNNSFSIQADQTSDGYLNSDLVLAQATSKTYNASTPVALQFKHLLSKINITINKAEGASVDLSNATVTITNTLPTITFKPSATDDGDDKILGEASGTASNITAVSELGTATTACAIIVPQTLAAGTALVKIETGSNATSGANRTLIAKLGSATTFASGQSYNFTVTVNDLAEPTTEPDYVTLEAGSDNLVQWGNTDLGASTTEAYVAGDYVLKDGSLVHKANLTESQKQYVRAIVFTNSSDELSAEDKEAGYVGYAMSVVRMGSKQWLDSNSHNDSGETDPNDFSASLIALNGLSKTERLQTAWNIDANSGTWGSAFVNFTTFTSSSNPLEAGALVGATSGNKNLSGWFAPSFGQMIMILNNLGNASITSDLANATGFDWNKGNGDFYVSSSSSVLSTINGLVQNDLGETNPLFANGYVFTTVTENGSNFFFVKVIDENLNYGLGKTAGKSGTNRSVLPIVAFKLPSND